MTVASEGPDAGAPFHRPPDVPGSFAPRDEVPPYVPPPPTVPPEDRARYARPAGAGSYAPPQHERIGPAPTYRPAVPAMLAHAFGAPPSAQDGFAPAPGTRIAPQPRRESPWWRPGAHRDPWRDPNSPYWLGRGAVYHRGRPAQLDPDFDTETDAGDLDEPPVDGEPEEVLDEPAPPRRTRFGLRALTLVLLATLLAGGIGGGVGYWLANRANHLLHRDDVTLSTVDHPANRPPGSVAAIAKKVGPAVVSIAVTTSSEYAVGSGVVIDRNGYVLTNNHVISAAANGQDASIVVTFSDEATATAQIVGADTVSDIAVLKVPSD